MPLNTQVIREGKPRKDIKWDSYDYVNMMYTAALKEQDPEFIERLFVDLPQDIWQIEWEGEEYDRFIDFYMGVYYLDSKCDLVTKGSQVLTQQHRFLTQQGEVVEFNPGDELKAWRSHKS